MDGLPPPPQPGEGQVDHPLKTDERKDSKDTEEAYEWDPKRPEDLVGKRVEVQWAGARFYGGEIRRYDAMKGEHYMVYDDNDKRWYRMAQKTWRVEGQDTIHRATTNLAPYRAPYVPYVSKNPRARCMITFHCLLDPLFVQGGRVVVIGSLAELGGWNENNGAVMQRTNPDTPDIWTVTVHAPLGLNERSRSGVFEYKFAVVDGDGTVCQEGGLTRRPEVVRPHYFGFFEHNPRLYRKRCENVAKYSSKKSFQAFCRAGFQQLLLAGGSDERFPSPAQYLTQLDALVDSHPYSTRHQAMEVLDDIHKELTSAKRVLTPVQMLCALAIVGVFGLSSRDKVEVRYTYRNGYRQLTKPPSPPAKPWCWWALEELPVLESCYLDLKHVMGGLHKLAINGLQEAAERVHGGGSLRWLRCYPLLARHKGTPTNARGSKNKGKLYGEYAEVSAELAMLAAAAFEQGNAEDAASKQLQQQQKQQQQQLEKETGKVAAAPAVLPPPKSPATGVARQWLNSSIVYAPHIDCMCTLFQTPEYSGFAPLLLGEVCNWVRTCNWSKPSQFDTLTKMVKAAPALRTPQLASAVFRNSAQGRDTEKAMEMAKLTFCKLCVGDALASSAADKEGGEEEEEKKEEVVDVDEASSSAAAAPAPSSLLSDPDANLMALESAAKEWFRRNHAAKEKVEDSSDDNGFGWVSAYRKPKPPPPTQAELDAQRLAQLERAVSILGALYTIPFLARRSRGLLFELSRCHFLRGEPNTVLKAICALGKQVKKVSAIVGDWLCLRGVNLLKEVVGSSDADQITALVDTINTLAPDSDLCHTFLYTLAHATSGSPPQLNRILRHWQLWQKLFKCRGVKPSKWASPSLLHDILRQARQELVSTAEAIGSGSVGLKVLHTALRSEAAFMSLLSLLKGEALLPAKVLASRTHELVRFDRELAEVRCFVSFFCNCGVRVDAREIRAQLSNLTDRYDSLKLSSVQGVFKALQSTHGTALPWLFGLRSSALFLALWRRVGSALVSKKQRAMEGQEHAAASHADEDEDDEEERKNEVEDEEIAVAVAAVEAELTQHEVAKSLLPAVKQEWRALMESIKSHSASVTQLGRTFGTLSTDKEYQSEVLTLWRTGDGTVQSVGSDLPAWVKASSSKLKDFRLLRQMKNWLPALLAIRSIASDLFSSPHEEDRDYLALQQVVTLIDEQWEAQTLGSLSELVEPVNAAVPAGMTANQMDFLQVLSECPDLVKWLLGHESTQEFNRLMQVCRPCTDEPRLLASIASLVQIRTLLLGVLYVGNDKYPSLNALLNRFRDEVDLGGDEAFWHLRNTQSSFEGLLDVMERQTRSPGIKSCFDIRDISLFGSFVFSASGDENEVLKLEVDLTAKAAFQQASAAAAQAQLAEQDKHKPGHQEKDRGQSKEKEKGKEEEAPEEQQQQQQQQQKGVQTEDLSYLLDLRSKILMTEIPDELEKELGMQSLIDTFVTQLEVVIKMKDTLSLLYNAGHFDYQQGFTIRFRFDEEGMASLRGRLVAAQHDIRRWTRVVKQSRDAHFYLNYYPMREVLRLKEYLDDIAKRGGLESEKSSNPRPPSGAKPKAQQAHSSIDDDAAFAAALAAADGHGPAAAGAAPGGNTWACFACTFVNQLNDRRCMICNTGRPASYDEPTSSAFDYDMLRREQALRLSAQDGAEAALEGFLSMLHLVSSSVDRQRVRNAVSQWEVLVTEAVANHANDDGADDDDNNASAQQGADENGAAKATPGQLLHAVGAVLEKALSTNGKPVLSRVIPLPGEGAKHRADLLIAVKDGGNEGKSLPVWVSCAESPRHVIELVLSVYVRRARLPEPGEIVFCTLDTKLETIELLFRRFLLAKREGRSDFVFCVADIHALSYTAQVALGARLRVLLGEYGTESAASLLLVSGKPRQVLLNSLSAQQIDLPPLDADTLRVACSHAFKKHCGETECVASTINGGGKTHYVLRTVSGRQKIGDKLAYHRIPYREGSSAASLVSLFSNTFNAPIDDKGGKNKHFQQPRNAFHMDIGHIIPADANTCLFELLIVGVLKNEDTNQVYHRDSNDVFLVEIPNSVGGKTAQALRFCQLLPTTVLKVTADAMDMTRPIFSDPLHTKIEMPLNQKVAFVCKYLRAYELGTFRPGSQTYNPDFSPHTDRDISAKECFHLLSQYTAMDGHPSFLVFHSFLEFMSRAFHGVDSYPVFSGACLQGTEGLEALKDVFSRLLIETSKDFTLRAVPRGAQFGRVAIGVNETGEELAKMAAKGDQDAAQRLKRLNQRQAIAAAAAQAAAGVPSAPGPPGSAVAANDGSGSDSDASVLLAGLAPPPLLRRVSSQKMIDAERLRPPALLRHLSNGIADRFADMRTWEDTEHPVVLFYQSPLDQDVVEGMDILSLNPNFLSRYIKADMKQALEANKIDLERDWKDLQSEQGVIILRKVEGNHYGGVGAGGPVIMGAGQTGGGLRIDAVEPTYVVTVDNLLKMLSIQLRIKNGLPVIIMGETGCGKSSLIRQLCSIIRAPLCTLNIHGGMEDEDIIAWMQDRVTDSARLLRGEQMVVFLDEVNTCNSMGLFKEMVCDGSMNGIPLPGNMKVIAACNPYRLKKGIGAQEEMAGLLFDHHFSRANFGENVGTGITDPLRNLVYRVHPLPESMVDHVFDFGALDPQTESLYIRAMLKRQLAIYITDEDINGLKGEEQDPANAAKQAAENQEMAAMDIAELMRIASAPIKKPRVTFGFGSQAPPAAPADGAAAGAPAGPDFSGMGSFNPGYAAPTASSRRRAGSGSGSGGGGLFRRFRRRREARQREEEARAREQAEAAARSIGVSAEEVHEQQQLMQLLNRKDSGDKGKDKGAAEGGDMGAAEEDDSPEVAAAKARRERARKELNRRKMASILQRIQSQAEGDGGDIGPIPELDDPEMQAFIRSRMENQLLETKGKWGREATLTDFGEFVEVFAALICASQEFVRALHGGERSVVSLRDVARCVKVYRWFGEHFAKMEQQRASKAAKDGGENEAGGDHDNGKKGKKDKGKKGKAGGKGPKYTLADFFSVKAKARPHVRQAVIMSLAYCYHARLPRDQRRQFRKHLVDTWGELQRPLPPPPRPSWSMYFNHLWTPPVKYGPRSTWLKLSDPETGFNRVLHRVQASFVKNMNLGEGIALNEALLENLFMILVSVLNNIPIFVIGKPGSSKSLAMGLVQSNLNGDASENEFLRALPAVEVFSYQCSPLSTSQGIQEAFEAAARYKREVPGTQVVVLLDEVGLAEQSPHLPLKVLHKVLDEDNEQAVVGISNWALDPAKMNRAVHLYRPAPTVEDLSATAEGMVRSASLKGYLQSLARAYNEVYRAQKQPDFWGLREFYSTVRHINRELSARDDKTLKPQIVLEAVLRNYGGRSPAEMKGVVNVFFTSLGMEQAGASSLSVVELVSQNIMSKEARHLMLLTKNNAALGLLFDEAILDHSHTEVIFGSDFPLDQTDLQICLNIQRIKLCMASGVTVVLVHCESLYESLYDLLNQHYTEYGGQLYVRLAVGTNSKLCPIHRDFRVICIVEKTDAYTRLAPPLLNRFEKQVMERQHLLEDSHRQLVARLQGFANAFAGKATDDGDDAEVSAAAAAAAAAKAEAEALSGRQQPSTEAASLNSLRNAFCGFHGDVLSSLAKSIDMVRFPDVESRYQEAVKRLLWVATPEAACRVLVDKKRNALLQEEHHINVIDTYFKQQAHGDLASFIKRVDEDKDDWQDELGAQVSVLSFSPLTSAVGDVIREQTPWKDVRVTALHQLDSERDLREQVDNFFETCEDGSVLLLQCDPLAASLRRIEHAKYIVENARARHLRKVRDERNPPPPYVEEEGASEVAADGNNDNNNNNNNPSPSKDQDDEKTEEVVDADADAPAAVDKVAKKETARGVHVVMLLHLPRNEVSYAFDFDLRWRCAFIDSVEPAANTGLPSIRDMLGYSMADIIASLDLRKVLLKYFRIAIARLVYLHERTNDDVRRQIVFILGALQEGNDDDFVTAIRERISGMAKASELELDLMGASKQEHELALSGTFQATLHRQIAATVSSLFALLLSHMDRNSNLFLLGSSSSSEEERRMRGTWLYLFQRSFADMDVFETRQASSSSKGGLGAMRAIDVLVDGTAGQAFEARFPFSFYLVRVLDSMRAAVENVANTTKTSASKQPSGPDGGIQGSADDDGNGVDADANVDNDKEQGQKQHERIALVSSALQQQVSLLALQQGLEAPLPDALARRYVHDLTAMTAVYSRNLDRETQSEMVWAALRLCVVDKNEKQQMQQQQQQLGRLAGIHARYWHCEKALHSYFTLIDKVPAAKPAIAAYLSERASGWGYETDLQVVLLVIESLSVARQEWRRAGEHAAWLAAVQAIRSAVALLLTTRSTEANEDNKDLCALAKHTKEAWEKTLLNFTFIRDISVPLRLEPRLTIETLGKLQGTKLRTQATFRVLIKTLSDLNREYSRADAELECAICLRIPRDPVRYCGRPECQRMVCKQCADDFRASKVFLEGGRCCFWCRQPNSPPPVVRPRDRELCTNGAQKEVLLKSCASRFMEFYIFDFVFASPTSDAEQSIEAALLHDFMRMLAKRPLLNNDGNDGSANDKSDSKYYIDIVPSAAGRASLLRSLLQLQQPDTKRLVNALLLTELKQSVDTLGYPDTPLSVCYASVQEEHFTRTTTHTAHAIQLAQGIDLAHLQPGSDTPVVQVLTTLAKARRVLVVLAVGICEALDARANSAAAAAAAGHRSVFPPSSSSPSARAKELRALCEALEPVMGGGAAAAAAAAAQQPAGAKGAAAAPSSSVSRSLWMFLLRNLEKRRGVSFVRSALQQAPLTDTMWLQRWKATGEVGLTRFLGTNKLPRHNPFTRLPLWREVHTALCSDLAPAARGFSNTEQCIKAIIDSGGGPKLLGQLKGALVAACFHEVFLLRALPEVPAVTAARGRELVKWLRAHEYTHALFDQVPGEKAILLFFAGDSEKSLACEHQRVAASFLAINPGSSPEHIALCRLVCHVAVAAMACGPHDLGKLLHTCMTDVSALANTFLPAGPEDVNAMAVRVLGGRWYKCPNGHAYYVDACGRPTVIQKCATCKVDIGGLNHNLLKGQKDLDENLEGNKDYSQKSNLADQSEPGYCFRKASEESDPFDHTARGMSPLSTRAMRFLLHSSLLLGALGGDKRWLRGVPAVLNRAYCDVKASHMPVYLSEHTQSDWDVLCSVVRRSSDDVCVLAHRLLHSLGTDAEPNKLPRVVLKKASDRQEWESAVSSRLVEPLLGSDGVENRIRSILKSFKAASGKAQEEGSVFVAELQEKVDIDAMAPAVRGKAWPALWRYRKGFSLPEFKLDLKLARNSDVNYPLLSSFLQDEPKMRALQHLPAVIQWQALLLQRYNRSLGHAEAQKMTVDEVLSSASDRARWESAFSGFAQAWNLSWRYVERFECTPIPDVYKGIRMGRDTPIAFSLASEKDEGICPLSLARFLGETHNRFVERVDEVLLMRGEVERATRSQGNTVSSKFFSTSHTLSYDLEGGFVPFLEKQCVVYGRSGAVTYNFRNAEQYLLDVFFSSKPLLDLEVRMFQYASAHGGSSLGQGEASMLRQKVAQEALDKETASAIMKELGSLSEARRCLELLETCITFLQATGGSFVRKLAGVGERTLGQYARDTLMLPEAEFGSRTVVTKVQLKHIDSLWRLLRDSTVADPFAGVRPKYRDSLDEAQAETVAAACAVLDLEVLLPLMKEFIISQLCEDHTSAQAHIADSLGYMEDNDAFLSSYEWFQQGFPAKIQMQHALDMYLVLEAGATLTKQAKK